MMEPRSILVCYDGSREAKRALDRVAEITAAAPTRVTVVSVADPIYRDPPWTGYADPEEEQAHGRLLQEAVQELGHHGVDATAVEPIGGTSDSIAGVARERDADLIVVGSRHRSLLKRLLFGSVSVELAAEAPCDVLVVRCPDDAREDGS